MTKGRIRKVENARTKVVGVCVVDVACGCYGLIYAMPDSAYLVIASVLE